jgi:hypothetical protein
MYQGEPDQDRLLDMSNIHFARILAGPVSFDMENRLIQLILLMTFVVRRHCTAAKVHCAWERHVGVVGLHDKAM